MSSAETPILKKIKYIGLKGGIMPRKDLPESMRPVGARLDLIRLAMGWENQFIAQLIGISPQQWRNYKKGDNVFPPEVAVKLCTVTPVTTDFIYRNDRSRLPDDFLRKIAQIESGADKRPARRA